MSNTDSLFISLQMMATKRPGTPEGAVGILFESEKVYFGDFREIMLKHGDYLGVCFLSHCLSGGMGIPSLPNCKLRIFKRVASSHQSLRRYMKSEDASDTDALIRIIEDEFIDIYSGVGPRKSLQDIRLSLWNEKISLCNDEDNAKTLLAKLAPTRKTLRCLVHMACFAVGQVTKQPKSPLDLKSLGSYDGATNWIWDVPDLTPTKTRDMEIFEGVPLGCGCFSKCTLDKCSCLKFAGSCCSACICSCK
ncbi:hypothetical protein Ciccas_009384 [Cichlidogyrus casuarinus]|uniref:Tesmin/TSO1-like CXC domain-containing protein n=1 Tax=Cichlidogyrus casuarinus TaxID=1844966 RepID=A0ABD2PX76_9PLAT